MIQEDKELNCEHFFIEDEVELINDINNPIIKKIIYCELCYLVKK